MRGTLIGNGEMLVVHVDGLEELMRGLKESDPKLKRAAQRGIRAAMSPILASARSNASSIADDGTFAGSISIGSRRNGAAWVIRSTDPAAGVKEFARIGAKTVSSSGTPLAESRLRKGSGVGVPRRAHAPRAIVPAVNDNAQRVLESVDSELASVLDAIGR